MFNKYIKKEKFYRKKILKKEKERLLFKFIFYSTELSSNIRKKAYKVYDNKIYSKVRLNKRCVITGRSKSTISKFKLSRITFRNLASKGYITGVKKLSW